MNTQRVKSIGIITAVLIAGIVLGLLIPGTFHHMRGRQHAKMDQRNGNGHGNEKRRNDWFVYRIKQVVNADSIQVKQIDTVALWANKRLDSIERHANEQSIHVIDSAVTRLTPILRDDQKKSLQEFREQIATRAKEHRRHQ